MLEQKGTGTVCFVAIDREGRPCAKRIENLQGPGIEPLDASVHDQLREVQIGISFDVWKLMLARQCLPRRMAAAASWSPRGREGTRPVDMGLRQIDALAAGEVFIEEDQRDFGNDYQRGQEAWMRKR